MTSKARQNPIIFIQEREDVISYFIVMMSQHQSNYVVCTTELNHFKILSIISEIIILQPNPTKIRGCTCSSLIQYSKS